jgi:hypothetical protein
VRLSASILMLRRDLIAYGLLPLLLLGSCVTPVCGCSFPPPGVDVRGTLQTAGAQPQAGFRVRAELATLPCGAFVEHSVSPPTGADGAFALSLQAGVSDSVCVRLFAQDTLPGAPEIAFPSVHRTLLRRPPYPTLQLVLTLPP